MNTKAVIGCGFGDCGKGKTVSSLCLQAEKPLVVRFSGGQQAGHGVVTAEGLEHRFANFSSGTLHGADTYWSRFCTMDPVGIMNELEVLRDKGIKPWLYIDTHCAITTPYEKQFNRDIDSINGHGTCGVGIGQTYQREQDHFTLQARDLLYPSVFEIKLELLRKYYDPIHHPDPIHIESFIAACNQMMNSGVVTIVEYMPRNAGYSDIIFEGSQGLMLDESIGFFPHVTRGHTGLTNIMHMEVMVPELFLVTRAYQTRHGAGPMTNRDMIQYTIPENPYERSTEENYAGEFRTSVLDVDLLKYAISNDHYITACPKHRKTLVVTCLDIPKEHVFTSRGKEYEFANGYEFTKTLAGYLGFERCIMSASPVAGEWKEICSSKL